MKHRDWSTYEGPGKEHFLREEVPFIEVPDPLEPVNRVLSWANYGVLRYVLAPLGRGYRFVVPRPVRKGLENFTTNLGYPGRVVNNLLQGKWRPSWDETRRFALNSTVGVVGLFDPATHVWEIPASEEDFGQTFARAGWRESTYLFVPLIGPTTVRDVTGWIGDTSLHPLRYVPWAFPAARFNDESDEFDGILRVIHSNYDAYQLARLMYTLTRVVDNTDFTWKSDDSGEVETLAAVFLEPEDPEFSERRETHAVRLLEDAPPLRYSAWMQRSPAPVVFLLPGLGAHRLSDSTVAMAEVAYGYGASVVSLSSTMNFEFMQRGASTPTPGDLPVDAADVDRALRAIDRDLERRHPGHAHGREKLLVGISQGAAQALHIAAARTDPQGEAVEFDVYVAIDPPVSLGYAAQQLDEYYNAPLAFAAEEREERMQEILAKVIDLAEARLRPVRELPFTRLEAEYVIGLSFRLILQSALLASQERHDTGVLLTERDPLRLAPAFREASEYSFMEYLYAFLLPYSVEHVEGFTLDEAGAQRLFDRGDLRSIEQPLRENARIRVFANSNDFLLGPEDRKWLVDVFGERAVLFEEGGHLGNLHRAQIQEVIRAIVGRAGEEADAAEG